MRHIGDLVTELELRLGEYQHGDWTEPELRVLVQPLTWPGVTSVDIDPVRVASMARFLAPPSEPVDSVIEEALTMDVKPIPLPQQTIIGAVAV